MNAKMDGVEFSNQLDDLLGRALDKTSTVGMPRAIYELEMAKSRLVQLQLVREEQAAMAEASKKIIQVGNIKMPPMPPPQPGN
jgi:DNA-binding TFAR19-related protein (PDSD5 family)